MTKCLLMIPEIKDNHLSKSPPLGIAYIASNLEKNGIKVKIIDSPTEELNSCQILKIIKRFKPDFVGISVTMQSYIKACAHADAIKNIFPKCWIIFGGPIVTFESEKIITEFKNVDICVRGEGEITMLKLIKTINQNKKLENISGITWRNKDKVVKNEDRPQIPNLDILPSPAWHLLPMSKYRGTTDLNGGKPFTTMIASRGCLFNCKFCAARIMWKGQRRRSIKNVIDEMEYLHKKYDIRYLHFPDDLLLAKNDYALSFCQEIIKRKLNKIRWSCNGRVSLANKQLLSILKMAGCVCVFYGIESGNQKILNKIDKGVTIHQIKQAIKLTHQAGLKASGSFLVGYPEETEKSIKQTVSLAIDLDIDYASFHIVVPYPGTPLYAECQKKDLLLSDRWEKYILDIYGEPNQSVIKLENLSSKRLIQLYQWANNRFTYRIPYLIKIIRNHPLLLIETSYKSLLNKVKRLFGNNLYQEFC